MIELSCINKAHIVIVLKISYAAIERAESILRNLCYKLWITHAFGSPLNASWVLVSCASFLFRVNYLCSLFNIHRAPKLYYNE